MLFYLTVCYLVADRSNTSAKSEQDVGPWDPLLNIPVYLSYVSANSAIIYNIYIILYYI